MNKLLPLILLTLLPHLVWAEGRFRVVFEKPDSHIAREIRQLLQGSRIVEQAAADLNELVHLPDTITIRFGAADGPHYDPNIGEIWFPYEFAALVGQLFAESDYVETQDELETAILDTVEFVLFHEIGHALIHQLELPVTGKEEDAVDMLAAILLVGIPRGWRRNCAERGECL